MLGAPAERRVDWTRLLFRLMEFELRRRPSKTAHVPAVQDLRRKQLPIQRRLAVGASDDPHERDADRVADDVVRRLNAPERVVGEDPVRTGSSSRVSRRASAGGGDGFDAPAHVEQGIQQQRGGGSPLDSGTRARFEGAMGADLSGVRIHQDAASDHLNSQVSARAFTTGQDVFFSAGTYAPNSREGQHLLAHELAHTVQQGGAVQRQPIRRLAVKNTDFAKTTSVQVFSGGATGNVAKFSDAKGAVIVKVDQAIGNEVAVADKLHGKVGKKQSGKGFGVDGPGSRVATPDEVRAIKVAALRCIDANSNPRNFLIGLDSPNPVIVADLKTGIKFADIAESAQTAKIDPDGDGVARIVNTESVAVQLLHEGPALRALAQNAPADIVMGMGDRILGMWNPENFLYDHAKKMFSFVDNTHNHGGGFLTTVDLGGGDILTNEDAFMEWSGLPRSVTLRDQNYSAIAAQMYNTVVGGVNNSHTGKGSRVLKQEFEAIFDQQKPFLLAQIEKGLAVGRKKVMTQIKKPASLVSGVQAHKQVQAMEGLLARYHFLSGLDPAAAWRLAKVQAAKYAPKSAKPSRPTSGAPQQKPVAQGRQMPALPDVPRPRLRMPALPKIPGH